MKSPIYPYVDLVLAYLCTTLVLFTAAFAQEYTIEDFESIDDWQLVNYYGMSTGATAFSPNDTKSMHLRNNLNYGDELLKHLNVVKSYLRYDRVEFWFYSNNTYTDVVLKIVDKGGNERCKASVTFGLEPSVWHLFNRSIIDFQDCKNKYMDSLGSISFYLNDYPSDFYAGPINLVSSNISDENFTSEPGWIYVYDVGVSPEISPKGKPISISCKVLAENFIDNVTVNIFNGAFNETYFMEKILGNLTQGTYRYVFDPQPSDPDGRYFFRIFATDYGGNSTYSGLYNFFVNSTLMVSFETDKQVYNLSDTMQITGTAEDVNYHYVPGNLTVTISDTGWTDSFSEGGFFGTFETSYSIIDAPLGLINLDLFFDDQHGNTGTAAGTVYLNDPYQYFNYTLNILSPGNGTSYFVADTIELEAELFQGPNPVTDAGMFALAGQTQVPMYLSETSYRSNFTIGSAGQLKVTFIGSNGDFMGVNSTEILVYELPDVNPQQPPPGYPGGTISVSFNITFGNGTPMTGLNITANSPTTSVPLDEVAPGVYNGTYTPGFWDAGQWNMTVDINGNTLDTDMLISVNLLSLESILIIIMMVIILATIMVIRLRGV